MQAHNARGDSHLATTLDYFYFQVARGSRPRVLALTASPAAEEVGTKGEKSAAVLQSEVIERLARAQSDFDATLWSAHVDASQCDSASQRVHVCESYRKDLPADAKHLVGFVSRAIETNGPSEGDVTGFAPEECGWLQKVWNPRIVKRIKDLGENIGPWACFRAARLLAYELMRGNVQQSVCFDPRDEEDNVPPPRSEGFTRLQRLVGARIDEWLVQHAHLESDPCVDRAAYSDKVESLVNVLRRRAPSKCLVFAQRRLTVKILCELLQSLLATSTDVAASDDAEGGTMAPVGGEGQQQPWTVDCLMSVNASRSATEFSAAEYARAITSFRGSLRLLVTTSTVDEGLDVPSCDGVVNFDKPLNNRQQLQRGGRARTPGAMYVTLVPEGDEGNDVRNEIRRMEEWNSMVTATLEALRQPGAQTLPIRYRKPVALHTSALTTAGGAVLPGPRCADFLKSFVYKTKVVLRGSGGSREVVDQYCTHNGRKFRTSEFFHTTKEGEQGPYRCTLMLVLPGMCTIPPAATKAFGPENRLRLPPTEPCQNKDEAEAAAALAGCRKLHELGLIDDGLEIPGREEMKASLAVGAERPQRASRRANAHELALKEPVQRRLPRCFEPTPELATALEATMPSAPPVKLYLHPILLDSVAVGLGLLLPRACPALAPFQLGPDGKARQTCMLGPAQPLTLDAPHLASLTAWQVATFDLVQAGNAHEPLHPLLRAPTQILRWDSHGGTYSSAHIASGETLPSAPHPIDTQVQEARRWRAEAPPGDVERIEWLAAKLAPLVAPRSALGSESSSTRALVPVFDLDHTIWFGNCDEWPSSGLRRVENGPDGRLQVYEPRLGHLELFPDVPIILQALRSLGAPFAIASASSARESAHALLAAFGLDPSSLVIEMRDPSSDETATTANSKESMLRRLADERLRVPVETMVLFDDMPEHLKTARGLNAGGRLIDPLTDGLTVDALLAGLEQHAEERRKRGELDARGFTVKEQAINNDEERRKEQQNRHAREGERHALADEAPARAKLEKLQITPAFWLAAPLRASAASAQEADPVDWGLVQSVRDYCECEPCRWPSIDERSDPLVAQYLRPVPPPIKTHAEDASSENVVQHHLELCALMAWPNTHFDLFKDVAVNADGTVSGFKRSRGINVSTTAATRTQQAGGRHRTEHTLFRAGYQQRRAHVLPLKSAHIDALLCLRRIIWRVQHLALLVESDGLRALQGASGDWLPAHLVPVPLSLHAAALTHREAATEAPEPLLCRASPTSLLWVTAEEVAKVGSTLDAARVDVRGCCDYEVLEWLGDAALDLLAKSVTMALHDTEGVQTLNPQAELLLMNKNLWRQAKRIELPCLALFCPFEVKRRLPDMTKQLMAPKAQADLMEALMGALCLAQMEHGAPSNLQPLSRGLDAAYAFFRTFICGESAQQQTAARKLLDPATMLRATMLKVTRMEARANADKMGAAISNAFLPGVGFVNRLDLLQECCAWSDDKINGKPFQRLELIGDAFLQCKNATHRTCRR